MATEKLMYKWSKFKSGVVFHFHVGIIAAKILDLEMLIDFLEIFCVAVVISELSKHYR